ncbi:MAG: hypothetical protein RR614_14915, partial [Eubacterium sp.]
LEPMSDTRGIKVTLQSDGSSYDGVIKCKTDNSSEGKLISTRATDYSVTIPTTIALGETSVAESGVAELPDVTAGFTISNSTADCDGVKQLSVSVQGSGTDGAFTMAYGSDKNLLYHVYSVSGDTTTEISPKGVLANWILDGSTQSVTGSIKVARDDINAIKFEGSTDVYFDLTGNLTFTPTMSYVVQ